ncbi:hypothetical protein FLK61_28565 [Paenalkalicoccus suaedae]|uniref:Uncharacterized protein n=1 Tax=Paenalkalicoccus suaedae TaxID=2592382 RepID=A0A859FEN3_9BACI|nr:hypothetical protein [Paenalkalicoccus suaedae]QKS70695.1 hypothetical protein FLK61_28565 [Paenalkalicoccus suaedae]
MNGIIFIICLAMALVGPVTRVLGYPSIYFYVISLVGIVGIVYIENSRRRS